LVVEKEGIHAFTLKNKTRKQNGDKINMIFALGYIIYNAYNYATNPR